MNDDVSTEIQSDQRAEVEDALYPVRGRQEPKYDLNLAGEYFVAGELNRRGIFATITYGSAKNADVLVVDAQTGRSAVIEVKTTIIREGKKNQSLTRWITGQNSIDEKSVRDNHFWVLVLLPASITATLLTIRFFVFTSAELVDIASVKHFLYKERYKKNHQIEFVDKKGVYGLVCADFDEAKMESQWEKITNWLQRK